MAEKRRATTFRTSKGTIVNVTYPDIYVQPGFIIPEDVTSPAELRGVLREELGLLESVFPRLGSPVRSDYPVLSPGVAGAWDEVDVHSNSVFRDWTGIYWMYYNTRFSPTPVANRGIGLATSPDGVVFTKNAGNPVILPDLATDDCLFKSVVLRYNQNDFRMWFASHRLILGSIWRIYYATSPNGIVWTRHPTPVFQSTTGAWDSYYVQDFRVVYDPAASIFRAVYVGRSSPLSVAQIGTATSLDGINWTKHPTPVMSPLAGSWEGWEIAPKNLLKKGNLYIMLYEGKSSLPNAFPDDWRIGLAYSTDLLTWKRDPRNPILGHGFPGDFDNVWVSDPTIVVDEDLIRLYHGTWNGTNGYAGLVLIPLRGSVRDYFRKSGVAWNNVAITGGDVSNGISCFGYPHKTIYFITNTGGNLRVDVREPDGGWQILFTETIAANTLGNFPLTQEAEMVRISFNTGATVTAWWNWDTEK